MTRPEAINLIVGLLGGGLIATVISIWSQSRQTRRTSERAHLDSALREVYGPIVRLLTESRTLFELNHDLQSSYYEHFNQPWHESAQQSVAQQADATLQTANVYVHMMVKNIDEVIGVIGAGWHLIDSEDLDVFNDVWRERVRMQVEFESA